MSDGASLAVTCTSAFGAAVEPDEGSDTLSSNDPCRRCAGPRLARTAVSAAPPQEFLQQQAPLQYDDSLLSASQPIEEREFNKEVANAVTIIGSAYRLELKYGAKPRLNGSLRVGRGEGKDPEWCVMYCKGGQSLKSAFPRVHS